MTTPKTLHLYLLARITRLVTLPMELVFDAARFQSRSLLGLYGIKLHG